MNIKLQRKDLTLDYRAKELDHICNSNKLYSDKIQRLGFFRPACANWAYNLYCVYTEFGQHFFTVAHGGGEQVYTKHAHIASLIERAIK